MKNADTPASPINEEDTDRIDSGISIYTGLTKREECAMRNLQGILANPEFHQKEDAQTMIDFAIEMADALLNELELIKQEAAKGKL